MPQTPPLPTRGEWVAACSTCTRLFDALVHGSFEPEGYPVAEHEELCAHLVAEHLDLLPPYREDCANCMEWQLLDPDGVAAIRLGKTTPGPRLVPVLGHVDLLHRAGHLIYADL
jgi:hypothetical protein